jgi:hypothetical protein
MRARPVGPAQARRALVFSHPPRNALSRALYVVFNLVMRLTGEQLSGHCHPSGAMLRALEAHGLRRSFERRAEPRRSLACTGLVECGAPPIRTPPDRDRTASLLHSHASSKQAETSRLICQNLT